MGASANSALLLLRHGQESPARGGPNGGHLSPLGQQQATLVAQRLRAEVPLRRIVSSTLTRAAETASAVQRCFPHLAIEQADTLRECIPNIPPHLSARFPEMMPDTLRANEARLDAVFDTFFGAAPAGVVLLVCHGNVIRYLMSQALGMPRTSWVGMDIHNAGLCRVGWSRSFGRQVTGFNDIGHLPLAAQTFR